MGFRNPINETRIHADIAAALAAAGVAQDDVDELAAQLLITGLGVPISRLISTRHVIY